MQTNRTSNQGYESIFGMRKQMEDPSPTGNINKTVIRHSNVFKYLSRQPMSRLVSQALAGESNRLARSRFL